MIGSGESLCPLLFVEEWLFFVEKWRDQTMVKVASVNLTLNLLCSSTGSSVSEVSVCEVVYLNRLYYLLTQSGICEMEAMLTHTNQFRLYRSSVYKPQLYNYDTLNNM